MTSEPLDATTLAQALTMAKFGRTDAEISDHTGLTIERIRRLIPTVKRA